MTVDLPELPSSQGVEGQEVDVPGTVQALRTTYKGCVVP